MRVGWCEVWCEGELVCGVRMSWCEVKVSVYCQVAVHYNFQRLFTEQQPSSQFHS